MDSLAGQSLGVAFVELDVTSDDSAATAVKKAAEQTDHLDVLVDNAGVGGPLTDPADMDAGALRPVYEANVFGPVRVTHMPTPPTPPVPSTVSRPWTMPRPRPRST